MREDEESEWPEGSLARAMDDLNIEVRKLKLCILEDIQKSPRKWVVFLALLPVIRLVLFYITGE